MTRSARHPLRYLLGWLLAGLALVTSAMGREAPVPASPSPHYVYDQAGWLTPATFNALDAKLQAYERETSSQLFVAIFASLPDDAEMVDFSQRVFEKWKPGTANKDNGAILFVFAAQRQLRIHTGYGLEGALPDARAKQIIANVITPLLRAGQREQAITAGVDAMIATTKGEYQGTGTTNLDRRPGNVASQVTVILVLLIVFYLFFRSRFETVIDHGGTRTTRWGGGFAGGGWSGGGGGWSSGGGGGFSGGGGSSGGGGASGSW